MPGHVCDLLGSHLGPIHTFRANFQLTGARIGIQRTQTSVVYMREQQIYDFYTPHVVSRIIFSTGSSSICWKLQTDIYFNHSKEEKYANRNKIKDGEWECWNVSRFNVILVAQALFLCGWVGVWRGGVIIVYSVHSPVLLSAQTITLKWLYPCNVTVSFSWLLSDTYQMSPQCDGSAQVSDFVCICVCYDVNLVSFTWADYWKNGCLCWIFFTPHYRTIVTHSCRVAPSFLTHTRYDTITTLLLEKHQIWAKLPDSLISIEYTVCLLLVLMYRFNS